MLKQNKILKFIACLVLILSLIGIIILFRKDKASVDSQIIPSKPSINKTYSGELNYKINIQEKDFIFPDTLPLMELQSAEISQTKINDIAKQIGFTGEPYVINDVIDGLTYLWKNDKGTLFCFPKSGIIRLSSNSTISTEKRLFTETEISSLVENFFYSYSIADKDTLKLNKVRYLKQDELTEKFIETDFNNASVYEVVFDPVLSNYEIKSLWTDQPTIYVQLLTDGSVYSAQFVNLIQIKNLETNYKIKKFQEFKDTLNQSVLISVKNAQLALSDLDSKAIDEIEITDIKLIYLKESTKSIYFQPAFLISGKTSVVNYGDNIEVSLYLPAISEK